MPSIVALIPARSGSQRIKDKNIKPLGGQPLIAYTIKTAQASGIFEDIVVSTDSQQYADIARRYGASVPFLRPKELSRDESQDIKWVAYVLKKLRREGNEYDSFSILRPTNPFRTLNTIQRAWTQFKNAVCIDSLRAVEPCSQHPGKMWVIRGKLLLPILPYETNAIPWHSNPSQFLPEIYTQNASLEIAWSEIGIGGYSISGTRIAPFITEGYEGFDINTQADWDYAEYLLEKGIVKL